MKKILCALACFWAFGGYASDFFVISNEPVFASASNAVEAQEKAIADGEIKAFSTLMDKLILHPMDKSKITTPSDLRVLVKDVNFSNAQSGQTTYQGLITVRFIADPIRKMLSQSGIEYISRLPEPMLLVPVFVDENDKIYEEDNPLYRVWKNNKLDNSLFSFYLPQTNADVIEKGKTAYQTNTYAGYKSLLQEANLSAVLILKIKKENEQYHITTSVLPENSAPEAQIELNVSDDRENMEKVLLDLSKDAIRTMTKKWLYLAQEKNATTQTYHFFAPLETMADLGRIKNKMKELNFAQDVSIKSMADKRLFIDISFKGDESDLFKKLALNNVKAIVSQDLAQDGQTLYEFVLTNNSQPVESSVNSSEVTDNGADLTQAPDLVDMVNQDVPDLTGDRTDSIPDLTGGADRVPDLTGESIDSIPDLTGEGTQQGVINNVPDFSEPTGTAF